MISPLASGDVTYTSEDFFVFARKFGERSLHYYRIASAVLAGLMVLTLVLDWALGQPLPIWQTELGFIAAAGLWALSTGRLQGRIVAKHARKIGAAVTQVFTVCAEGFEARGPSETSLTKWSDVPELEIIEDRLFVFMARNKAFIVPRRAFASDADFQGFVAAAREYWKVHHRL